MHLKNIIHEESSCFDNYLQILLIFGRIIAYLGKKNRALKDIIHEKTIFRQLNANFADYLRNNSIFLKMNHAFKKYHHRGNFTFNQSVAKNSKFCRF